MSIDNRLSTKWIAKYLAEFFNLPIQFSIMYIKSGYTVTLNNIAVDLPFHFIYA
jgi:hypothetical protein